MGSNVCSLLTSVRKTATLPVTRRVSNLNPPS